MKELIKINNKWVRSSRKERQDVVYRHRGDEPRPEVYKLSEKWQDKITLSEDLGQLRALLGWPLYQEWLRETITG